MPLLTSWRRRGRPAAALLAASAALVLLSAAGPADANGEAVGKDQGGGGLGQDHPIFVPAK